MSVNEYNISVSSGNVCVIEPTQEQRRVTEHDTDMLCMGTRIIEAMKECVYHNACFQDRK